MEWHANLYGEVMDEKNRVVLRPGPKNNHPWTEEEKLTHATLASMAPKMLKGLQYLREGRDQTPEQLAQYAETVLLEVENELMDKRSDI